jgi:hypothetical protein
MTWPKISLILALLVAILGYVCANPCPNQCSGSGHCDLPSHRCWCDTGYVGPACEIGDPYSATLSTFNNMYLLYKADPLQLDLIHFRIDSLQSNWLSLMITPAWEMIRHADSASAYVNESNGQWTLFDQFEHNFVDNPLNDTRQDLLHGTVWSPFAGAVSVSWSRMFQTGDFMQDIDLSKSST